MAFGDTLPDAPIRPFRRRKRRIMARGGLTYQKQREIYTAGGVRHRERTRLRRGTTFLCYLIIKGEPLFVSSITIGDMTLSTYVCGKVNGVQFEVIKKETGRAQQRHTS